MLYSTFRGRSSHRRCSKKFCKFHLEIPALSQVLRCKFHRKTPALFIWKLQALRPAKNTLTQVFSCKISEIFKNTYFEEQLRTVAISVTTSLSWYSEHLEHLLSLESSLRTVAFIPWIGDKVFKHTKIS